MAIYSTDPLKRCCALREAVQTGILEVVNNFRYMANVKGLTNIFTVRYAPLNHLNISVV